ncbi:TPA: AAA family ATPase [Escherichia coli]|nr:AAA family ATPase [Escherichia coli]HBI9662108.1 AAA family ATPase [Escherichia coli]HBM7573172.1 AAA family ATPase [Escherichia coli]
MSDIKNILKCMYFDKNRYSNFGSVIKSLEINGFRGIKKLTLNINFPVTAISGLNGAGKSTLGQLAICAYKKPVTAREYKRLYIKDFSLYLKPIQPLSIMTPVSFINMKQMIQRKHKM